MDKSLWKKAQNGSKNADDMAIDTDKQTQKNVRRTDTKARRIIKGK
jgi:hypothetical protein